MNTTFSSRFEIDTASVQRIVPAGRAERFEGIDFSSSGNIIAIATSEGNAVHLFRRSPDGRFEDAPYWTIKGPPSGLGYPHDVSFSKHQDTELLAVAQRTGAIAIYQSESDGAFGREPVVEIRGSQSRLAFSDGVSFVPPNNDYLAVCNLELATIAFFRRASLSPIAFEDTPEFELKHRSIFNPDGLGFSRCGRWLAVANHGKQTVSVYRRNNRMHSAGTISYGPRPITVINDRQFRYPHSVAFTPQNHLIVTNAGANFFGVYAPQQGLFGSRWSKTPVMRVIAHDDAEFKEVNIADKMEGGPKGVAIHDNKLAICSPQIGVKIFTFHEE